MSDTTKMEARIRECRVECQRRMKAQKPLNEVMGPLFLALMDLAMADDIRRAVTSLPVSLLRWVTFTPAEPCTVTGKNLLYRRTVSSNRTSGDALVGVPPPGRACGAISGTARG